MIQVNIKKSGIVTNGAKFETLTEADEWLNPHIAKGTFGIAKVSMQNIEISPDVYGQQEILDENNVSFDPPQFEEVLISPAQYEMQGVITEGGYEVEYLDITTQVTQEALINAKIALGEKAENACKKVRRLIGGFNIDRALTFEQKNQMKALFLDANDALKDNQPSYAKYFINLITPDEVLVTTEMKDLALLLLNEY
jgi:hypothetical protein